MLSVKQGGIKYDLLSLEYKTTCDWTPITQTISEHSTHYIIITTTAQSAGAVEYTDCISAED